MMFLIYMQTRSELSIKRLSYMYLLGRLTSSTYDTYLHVVRMVIRSARKIALKPRITHNILQPAVDTYGNIHTYVCILHR